MKLMDLFEAPGNKSDDQAKKRYFNIARDVIQLFKQRMDDAHDDALNIEAAEKEYARRLKADETIEEWYQSTKQTSGDAVADGRSKIFKTKGWREAKKALL